MSDWHDLQQIRMRILGEIRYCQGYSKEFYIKDCNLCNFLTEEEVTIKMIEQGCTDPEKIMYSKEWFMNHHWDGPIIKYWIYGWESKKKKSKHKGKFPNLTELEKHHNLPLFPYSGEKSIYDSLETLRKRRDQFLRKYEEGIYLT